MTIDEVIKYYGNLRRCTLAIGKSSQASYNWKRSGIIPVAVQILIEKQTDGALKANLDDAVVIKDKRKEIAQKSLSSFLKKIQSACADYGIYLVTDEPIKLKWMSKRTYDAHKYILKKNIDGDLLGTLRLEKKNV